MNRASFLLILPILNLIINEADGRRNGLRLLTKTALMEQERIMADAVVPTSYRSFKFRLYPNANQERELGIMLETHRRLYNAALEQRNFAWSQRRVSVRYGQQSAELPDLRVSNEWFKKTNHSSCQATLRRLEKAFQRFFERIKHGEKPGHPRFKGRDRFDSIEFPAYGDGTKLIEAKLRVQHVGVVKVKLHRPVEGRIKTVT